MSDFGDTGELVPDLPAPIRAYRAWSTDGTRLMGMGGVIWPAGEPLRARCQAVASPSGDDPYRRSMLTASMLSASARSRQGLVDPEPVRPHDCPSPTGADHNGYGCGVYAYKSPDRWAGMVSAESETVIGCVEMGGKVYEHEHGYRAEYAMPVAFYGDPTDDTLAFLAAIYDVPIEVPPWLDPTRARDVVNTAAKRQADQWDAAVEKAAAYAKRREEARAELAKANAEGREVDALQRLIEEAEAEEEPGQRYPNAPGYSDAFVIEIAGRMGDDEFTRRWVADKLNSDSNYFSYHQSALPKRDQYHATYGTPHPFRKAWTKPFGVRLCLFWIIAQTVAAAILWPLLHRPPYVQLTLIGLCAIRALYVWRRYGRG
jgi:hypothetical protein